MLGMTDSGIRRLIERGKLRARKVGRDWIIRKDDLAGITKSAAGRPRKTGE
jgi:excisionase family DNA binding protein